MDRDNLKGKMDDMKGRIKRQAGEWTGDQKLQDEGTGDQIKGKAQNARDPKRRIELQFFLEWMGGDPDAHTSGEERLTE